MRVVNIVIVCICFVTVTMLGTAVLSSRPWRSASRIQTSILKQTPLGSSVDDVRELIRKEHWGTCLDFQGNTSTKRDYTYTGVLGFHLLGASLPEYGFPFRVHTEAYWGFDPNEKLIDVHVRQWTEGM